MRQLKRERRWPWTTLLRWGALRALAAAVLMLPASASALEDRSGFLLPGASEAPQASAELLLDTVGAGLAAHYSPRPDQTLALQAFWLDGLFSYEQEQVVTLDYRRAWSFGSTRLAPWGGVVFYQDPDHQRLFLVTGAAAERKTDRWILHASSVLALAKTDTRQSVISVRWPALWDKHFGKNAPHTSHAVTLLPLAMELGAAVRFGRQHSIHLTLPYPGLSYRREGPGLTLRAGGFTDGDVWLVSARAGWSWE